MCEDSLLKLNVECNGRNSLQLYQSRTANIIETLHTFNRRLRKAWKSITLKTLKNIIGSMPDRIETELKSKGETNKC